MKLRPRASLAVLLALSIAIPSAAASASAESLSVDSLAIDSRTATVSGSVSLPSDPDLNIEDVRVGLMTYWSDGIGAVYVRLNLSLVPPIGGGAVSEAGTFTITGVPAGRYTLRITDGPWDFDREAPKYAGTYLGGGASAAAAVWFDVADGEQVGGKNFSLGLPEFINTTMRNNAGLTVPGTIGIWQGGTADNAGSLVKSVTAGQRTYLPRGSGYRLGYVCGPDATNNDGSLKPSPPPCMSQWWGGGYSYLGAPTFEVGGGTGVGGDGTPPLDGTIQDDPWWIGYGGNYVALGDSFQSGEGAYSYDPDTDWTYNKCHRSYDAYPPRLAANELQLLTSDFRACSGALMGHLYESFSLIGPPWSDGVSQLSALNDETRVVTLGIGGNDLGFSTTVADCVTATATHLAEQILFGVGYAYSCADEQGAEVSEKIASLESGILGRQLMTVYREVRERAPNARVLIITYPSFFPAAGTEPSTCALTIRPADQVWMNTMIRRADAALAKIAKSAGFEVVDMVDAFSGHEQCTTFEAMNNIIPSGDINIAASESFHPNAYGHQLMGNRIAAKLGVQYDPDFVILPGDTVTRGLSVTGSGLIVSTGWPGSDVVTSLVSPSGVEFTRENPRTAEHDFGPTWEYYRIENPEHGEWTVNTYGADVAVGGEMVTLTMTDEQPYNVMPTAEFSATSVGATVALDASASIDTDGSIVRYFWDFGDGTSAEGPVAEHTYENPGAYSVALVTTDNEGGQGFGTDEHVYEIEAPDPDPVPGPAVYSAKSLTVTNQFGTTGDAADVYVEGDYTCNSSVAIAGSVYATGNANLTNTCRITGDLLVGGNVKMNSSARVDGSVLAHGSVSIQSSNGIGGDVRAGTTFSTIDGKTNAYLLSHGVIGGVIETQASVPDLPESPAPVFQFAPEDWDGYATVNWKSWMNATAIVNNAPSWSQGRTSNPGCVMAPWGSSVNGSTVTVTGDTVIDARQASSGCTSVSLQSMTLRVSGDVVLLADSFSGINGLRIESADGAEHTVRLLVSGDQVACASAHAISLSAATVVAPEITLRVMTPGKVIINGTTTLRGNIAAGCVVASGNVKLEYVP